VHRYRDEGCKDALRILIVLFVEGILLGSVCCIIVMVFMVTISLPSDIIFQVLVSAGANLDAQDFDGLTALMVGVLGYDEAAPTLPGLKTLLLNGASLTLQELESGCTAADLALKHNKMPVLALLEDHGATVTSWRDTREAPPISSSARLTTAFQQSR
jgi:hypothetical protein